LNLGKQLGTFVVLSHFNYFCFICSLQTAELAQLTSVAPKQAVELINHGNGSVQNWYCLIF